jgi:hypothetical protein
MLACLDRLTAVRANDQVVLDSAGQILAEYLGQGLYKRFPPGPGLAFLVWVSDNQANPAHCTVVAVTELKDDVRLFAEFPDDPKLAKFDSADRKFVAAAVASGGKTPILNATDTDWRDFQAPLRSHGIVVEFLCPELMVEKKRK